MAYALAYQAAVEVANYFMEREKAKANAAQADKIIREVVNAINAAKQEILNEMREIRVKDLMGDYVGLGESLKFYLEIKKTEGFLLEIQSRADSLKGDLLVEVSGENSQMALESYPILMAATGLRCLLLSEFRHAWGADPGRTNAKILSEVKEVNRLSNNVLNPLRLRVGVHLDRRIQPVGFDRFRLTLTDPDTGEIVSLDRSEAHLETDCRRWLQSDIRSALDGECVKSWPDAVRTYRRMAYGSVHRSGIVSAALALGTAARMNTYALDRNFWDVGYFGWWEGWQRTIDEAMA